MFIGTVHQIHINYLPTIGVKQFFFQQLADPLDIIQQSANQLKNSNISAKQRAKSQKSKLNSETGEKTSHRVNFVRRSSRIIQEKR